MATLRSKGTKPPLGFWFIEPTSQLRIEGDSLGELVGRIIQHRVYKGLAPTDHATVQLEAERQICTRLSQSECRSEGRDDEWVPIKSKIGIPNPMAILGFSRAAIDWVAGGQQLVPLDEANRRAAICRGCQNNTALTGCKCSSFYKVINKAIPADRRLPGLGVCAACSCSLVAKVNLPMEVIESSNKGRDLQFPDFCWQRKSEGA